MALKNEKLKILTITSSNKIRGLFSKLEDSWGKFFFVEHIYDTPENIKKHFSSKIDIIFIQANKINFLQREGIERFKAKNPSFLVCFVTTTPSKKDVEYYKYFADIIIYTNREIEVLKWETIALARRYLNALKPTLIFHKNLIADFLEKKFTINGKEIKFTQKEQDLLYYFLKNKNIYLDREKIFKNVWKLDDLDSSRVLDQMIFKLKKKLGNEYFSTKRNEGIMLK